MNDDDLDFGITLDNDQATDRQLTPEANKNTHPKQLTNKIPSNPSVSQQPYSISLSKNDYSLANAAHPVACIFTILFKGLGFFIYLFAGMFLPNVLIFIIVMLMAATDFWIVKNISGRLLVGMRWWSVCDSNGKQEWKFETINQGNSTRTSINKVDKTFFWSTQILSTFVWGILLLIKLLSFSIFWGLLVSINFSLSALNLYGYYLCKGQKNSKKLANLGKKVGLKGLSKLASFN